MSKKGRSVQEKAAAPKEVRGRPVRSPPEAMVTARHGSGMVEMHAKGFSRREVQGAGLSPRLVAKWGVKLDARRRSALEGNVAMLRQWGGKGEPKAPGRRVRKVEEELKKVEEEVKKEAEEVEKEVVIVEKEVKREAAKAGKAVKARVRKPKAKAKKKGAK